MISKKFAKTVVEHWVSSGKPYVTKRFYYYGEYVRVNGWIEVRRVCPTEDPDFAELVAVYRMGKGWIICG